MAEPVSIAASAVGFVGLADVALRAGKELYASFSTFKDAPKEVKSLSSELTDLNDVLSDIQAFSSEYGQSPFSVKDGLKLERLIAALKTIHDDVAVLRKTLQPMESNASQGTVKQLKNRLQWAWMKDKLERLREELNRHKFTLLATLFVCGRRNDIQVRTVQHTIEQSLLGLHSSTARQYQALATNLQESAQSTKGAIKDLEVSNNRGLEIVQASISAQMRTLVTNTQLIRHDNFTMQQQIMEADHLATFTHEQTNPKLEEVAAPETMMNIGGREQKDWHLHFMDIDVESLALSVLLTKEALRDTLYAMCNDEEQGSLANENADVIWSEINKLLASSLEASASLANSRSRILFAGPQNSPQAQASHYYPSALTPEECSPRNKSVDARNGQGLGTRPFKRTRRTKYHLRMTPSGLLSIEMNCGATDDGIPMTSARVAFIPTIRSCRVGFVAQLLMLLQNATYSTISRQLSIVNIIPNEERLSGAWGTVPENDIMVLQRPSSGDIVKPFDRLDNDTTILWWAANSFKAVQILLQQGADPKSCQCILNALAVSRKWRNNTEEDGREFNEDLGNLLHFLGARS